MWLVKFGFVLKDVEQIVHTKGLKFRIHWSLPLCILRVDILPVIRVNELVPLEKLPVLERFVAFVASKPYAIIVLRLFVVEHRAQMVEPLVAKVTGIRTNFLGFL
jgi:hypothetical protein